MSDGRFTKVVSASLACSILLVNLGSATPSCAKSSKQSKASKASKGAKIIETKVEETAKPAEPVPVKKVMATSYSLGGTERYLTMLSTDKPIYRAGDKMYVRGVMLNALNKQPMPALPVVNRYAVIQIKGPKGDVIAAGNPQVANSVWSFAWEVPSHLSGGEYTATMIFPGSAIAPAERKFDVRAFRNPRLKSQIVFVRDGYAPGERVSAILDVKRAEGGAPVGAKVTVTATVDGATVNGETAEVDEKGLCRVSFNLPSEILRGEGTLALAIADGGVVETASKTIPILLKTVDLHLYPEGGDLIEGRKNRVYLEALQTNGKPADLVGKIMMTDNVTAEPQVVAEVKTEHEGRGRFEFTPQAGKAYYLSVSQPSGITKPFPLPEVKDHGAIIRSVQDTYKPYQPLTFDTTCSDDAYHVTLYKRECLVADQKIDASNRTSGETQRVQFYLPGNIDGVLTATVWSADGKPLAERLIFREASAPINISITPTKKSYTPGETAELTVKATNSDGAPISTVVGLTVTDETVLEMIDKREQAPNLAVMYFLEPEVQNLADAHVYMDAKNPKAPLATDLLLGTQGWRRFALFDSKQFVETHKDKARRVLGVGQSWTSPRALWDNQLRLPEEIGRVEGPRDVNLFQVEPTVIDERHFSTGRAERHQKPLATLAGVDKYTFFPADVLRQPDTTGERAMPRDTNAFQVSPSGLDERHYTSGRSERHQKTSPTLPEGTPLYNRLIGARIGEQGSMGSGWVREYAHTARPNRQANDRNDFTETLYWNAGVKTDAKTGEAKVSFALSDNVTTFRVNADAFSEDGNIGVTSVGLQSQQPFYTEAKLPQEVTVGDEILVPVSFVNTTDGALTAPVATFDVKGASAQNSFKKFDTALGAGERMRILQPIAIGTAIGNSTISVSTKAGDFRDQVTRQVQVTSDGFPAEQTYAGMLERDKSVVKTITVPKYVPGSLQVNAVAFLSPLGNLSQAMERLIRDPHGCFEQTSATTYPLTMAQQYFLTHPNVNPSNIELSRKKLDVGYKRLVSYWCPDRGFEWFGQNPGHEALTAFGLMHFTDMKKVREVDQDMLNITRDWLMKRKDGAGGFSRHNPGSHGWVENKSCANAYIVWALLECGQPAETLKDEIAWLKKEAQTNDNSYVTALVANVLYLSGDKGGAKSLMDRLAKKQLADGSVEGATHSIVGSGGESLKVEATSLATLAWLRDNAYAGNAGNSVKFLADSCKSGRYGSTQATVLALRSILAYDKNYSKKRQFGSVAVLVDDKQVGEIVAFNDTSDDALKLPASLAESLTPGEHKIELRMDGGNSMPYSIGLNYNALTPQSSEKCVMDIAVKMSDAKLTEGAPAEALVTVTNTSKEMVPNPVAIIGVPGGMEVRHDQLKEMVKKRKIAAYEVQGREVVLYWRGIAGNAAIEVPISLIAAVPGTYTAPASRAYLFYTDEHKRWTDGAKVEILPRVQVALIK